MVEWLERSDLDSEDDPTGLWGYYKTSYALRDLEKWLERKQKEARQDKKGKKKATRSQKGESSQKDRVDEEDETTSSPPKKSHKKSVGGHK